MDFDATTIRVFLHVLGASVWVGGQLVLGALVPTVRKLGDGATAQVARAFNRIAWPFFGLAVVTGIWNLVEVDVENSSSSYQVGVLVKLVVVAASGVSAYMHTTARNRAAMAALGAVSAVTALLALLLGASLATSF